MKNDAKETYMIIDQNIPYRHIIMRLDPQNYVRREPALPDGYSFHRYEDGDERSWARIQHSVNEFPTVEEALEYYCGWPKQYGAEYLSGTQFFVKSPQGELVADAMLRPVRENDHHLRVTRLDWVACMPEHQRKGLSTALLRYILNDAVERRPNDPIYLPTQPGSYAAVRMYWNLGFRVCRTSAIDDEEKPDAEAMEIIAPFYPDGFGEVLVKTMVE